MHGDASPPTVIAVDDDPAYVDAYTTWLGDDYDLRTATSGEAALDLLDETVDVVFLDRVMPNVTGDEVLEAIRCRGHDVRVAMITAVEPSVDIVDMPFDDYVVKPVTERELRETVEELLVRASFTDQVQECFSLVSKKTTLEVAHDDGELVDEDEYQQLESRLERLERDVNDHLAELVERGEVSKAYADIGS